MRLPRAALLAVATAVTVAAAHLTLTPAVAGEVPSAQVVSEVDVPGGVVPTSAISLPDGGLAVSGSSDGGPVIVRVAPDGSLDPRFGGQGWVRLPLEGESGASRVQVDETGALFLAGWWSPGPAPTGGPTDLATQWLLRGSRLFIAKVTPDGRLDKSFGDQGVVTSGPDELLPIDETAVDMVIAPGGRPVVLAISGVGISWLGYPSTTALVRFAADGRLDQTFGTAGYAVAGHPSALPGSVALALQPDGKLVVGSTLYDSFVSLWFPPSTDVVMRRFLPDGLPDPLFGVAGVSRHDPQGGADHLRSMAIDRAGRIVASLDAGESLLAAVPNGTDEDFGSSPALLRLLPDGTADPAFGGQGVAVLKRDPADRRLWFTSELAVTPGDELALAAYLGGMPPSLTVMGIGNSGNRAGTVDVALLDYPVALLSQPGRLLAVGLRKGAKTGIAVARLD